MPLEPTSVPLSSASIEPFRDLLEADQWEEFIRSMRETAGLLKNATVWNINSTAHGGGIAELLESQIPYQRELGIDVRWLVIQGGRAFFTFTKRLHTLLHGIAANGATVVHRQCPALGQWRNPSKRGRGASNATAITRMTVVWTRRAFRIQMVNIDQVSALPPSKCSCTLRRRERWST